MYEQEHRKSAGWFTTGMAIVFLICCLLLSSCSTFNGACRDARWEQNRIMQHGFKVQSELKGE